MVNFRKDGRLINKKLTYQWYKYPLIVIGYINIISIAFWIIHLLTIKESKKGIIYSAKDEFNLTAYNTGIFSVICMVFISLVSIFS